jgi:hypothetical protein
MGKCLEGQALSKAYNAYKKVTFFTSINRTNQRFLLKSVNRCLVQTAKQAEAGWCGVSSGLSETGGLWGTCSPRTDQLALLQPGGQIMPTTLLRAPPP